MKVSIELNVHEMRQSLIDGSLRALADSAYLLEAGNIRAIQEEETKSKKVTRGQAEKEAPTQADPAGTAEPEKPADEKPETTGKASSLKKEDLRVKSSALISAGKREEVRALLDKYNAERVTAVDPKDYDAFYAELEALETTDGE